MTRVQIQSAQYPLYEVFGPRFTFSVPAYQRPYAWTTKEACALFQDLCDALGEGDAPVNERPPYFLGSIVVVSDGAASPAIASIVDGQQRLTTLTILLSCLRALAEPSHASALNRHFYEEGSLYIDPTNRYRLVLRSRDTAFFRQYIQDSGNLPELVSLNTDELSDSQRNMRDNAKLYFEELNKQPETWRFRFAQYVLTQCLLLVVSTNDFDSAYNIFSVLNNRGRDLTYADILKARLFGEMPDHHRDGLMGLWEEIEGDLGREDFEKLFRHICMIHDRRKAQGSTLKQFEDYMTAYVGETSKQQWQVVGERVIPLGQAMTILKSCSYEAGDEAGEINATLRWLNVLPNSDWLPPAIAFLAQHKDDSAAVSRFLRDLERLAASMIARHFNDNDRIKRYATVLLAMSAGRSLAAADSPLQLSLDEQGATMKALNGSLAHLGPADIKYILRRLDASYSHSLPSRQDDVTVEHVLPLNPVVGSVWQQWYKDVKARKQYESRLGNLVLLPERFNRRAANKDFGDKRALYAEATKDSPSLRLAAMASAAYDWTPSMVESRQAALIGQLKELWRLEAIAPRAEVPVGLSPASPPPAVP